MPDCPVCSEYILNASAFCPNCGTPIQGHHPKKDTRKAEIKTALSEARDRVTKAKASWVYENDGNGPNWVWILGITLVFIGGGVGQALSGDSAAAQQASTSFFGCCLPVILLTCHPVYVKFRSEREVVRLSTELAVLEATSNNMRGRDGGE